MKLRNLLAIIGVGLTAYGCAAKQDIEFVQNLNMEMIQEASPELLETMCDSMIDTAEDYSHLDNELAMYDQAFLVCKEYEDGRGRMVTSIINETRRYNTGEGVLSLLEYGASIAQGDDWLTTKFSVEAIQQAERFTDAETKTKLYEFALRLDQSLREESQ